MFYSNTKPCKVLSDKKPKSDDGELVPTLPDVKQHAAKALGRAAKSGGLPPHAFKLIYIIVIQP